MSEQQIEPLSATEYDVIEKALWDLVKQYPTQENDPKDEDGEDIEAEYDALGADKSLAVFVLGGRYKRYDIVGGFTAEVNFKVAYKSQPRVSTQRIDRQAFVSRIMQWLENTKDLPLLTDGRKITKITVVDFSSKGETENDGSTVYESYAVMEYRKKGV